MQHDQIRVMGFRLLKKPSQSIKKQASIGEFRQLIIVGQLILIGFGRQSISDTENEFAGIHRFREKVGGSLIEGFQFGFGIGGGGENQNRGMRQV